MNRRDFDPTFSADLRRELVARAAAVRRSATARQQVAPHRQVWATIATAVVLLAVTIGVLQVAAPNSQPAAPPHTRRSATVDAVVDPLSVITDPAQSDRFLSRNPDVLLHAVGTDRTAHSRTLDIPAGVSTIRIWMSCSDGAHFAVSLPRRAATGSCSPDVSNPVDAPVTEGSRITIDYAVPEPGDSAYALLVVAIRDQE